MDKSGLLLALLIFSTSQWPQIPPTDALAKQPGRMMSSTENMAQDAVAKWAQSRQCLYTQPGVQYVSDKLWDTRSQLELKRIRYDLTPTQSQILVNAAVASYLDQATINSFGAERTNCVVDLRLLQGAKFAADSFAPDSGYLTVGGSQKGAAIKVDGKPVGYITQTFVLSVGEHEWQTMKCDEKVKIVPDDDKKVYCSKR